MLRSVPQLRESIELLQQGGSGAVNRARHGDEVGGVGFRKVRPAAE